ncbi:dolichyl-phosphate-mannose--protein mannosyltransferase [Microbacterium dauci]|uniref:Polyprenol-phosphate-mannose--protein mannosyltransferase n=1 Tax=Microbacterium dauci TaxID=3048008 RepID=A0ABT6ZAW7_9MICO|nr:phospholipid carrier-dependent glycosyltransferase [Microbacterium sp. LX3-4]MDJ1113307.1 phospholipid carrier-dependent glycosyltransferase [Microbacterium sp. LX3-4]
MTSTAEPLLPARPDARPSRYDAWRTRVAADPVLVRRMSWLAPLLVTLLGAVLRFWNLGHPRAIVFDETYYVKDSWSQWILGYAASWPDEADARFVAGKTDIFSTDPSFVVHPPLGKYLIGAGMALFGPDSSFGWRFAVAVAGTAIVLLVYLIAKHLSGSIPFATVASLLIAVDGLAIVMSRVAILDILLTAFVLLGFWFVLLDQRSHARRLATALADRAPDAWASWGPVRWHRPWLIASGAALGAASAVKWSGVWVLAAFGLYVVVTDAVARRRLGIRFWPLDALRQGVAAFVLLVPVSVVVYLASWTGWFVTDDGYGRHAADAAPATGIFAWVPMALQNLWKYHETIYTATAGITTEHRYASPAWQWPLLLRPTSMYANSTADGTEGCASVRGCIENVYSLPNPLIWWGGIIAIVWLAIRFVMLRDGRYAAVLVGFAATYVPWLLYPERTIFQFYTVLMLPFLVLALAFALRDVAGARHAEPERRLSGQRTVVVILTVIVALSAFWYPLWAAIRVPYEFYYLHFWLPGWV